MNPASNSRRVLSSRSPATKYEIMLLEDTSLATEKCPNESHMTTCFKVYDEVLPQLGVYRQLMGMLRDELYQAVYSNEYTTIPPKKARSKTPVIERVPYFVLVNRVFTERDENVESLKEIVSKLEASLGEKHESLKECNALVDDLRSKLRERRDETFKMQMELENRELEKRKMKADIECEAKLKQSMKEMYEQQLSKLRKELSETKDVVQFLEKYKKGYDDLEEAFIETPGLNKRPLKPAVLTKKANIVQEIASAKLLEDQLLAMRNTMIEEYDTYLEDHKVEPRNGEDASLSATSDAYELENEELMKQAEELQQIEERFKKNIADIENELQLTEIHCSGLEDHLAQLHETENKKQKKEEKKAKETTRPKSFREALESKDGKRNKVEIAEDEKEIDFVAIMSADNQDPFIPQERILSKYAAILFYSCNHGKNFHEFKDAKFCSSCGETTLICPHKIVEQDKVISLPHNCTNIKITRPTVHILTNEKAEFSAPGTPDSVRAQSADGSVVSYSEDSIIKAQQHLTTSYKHLWDDYFVRSTVKRRCPRPLYEDRVLSIIGQYYATIVWQDEYALEEEKVVSVLDTMYSFFQDRYLVSNVMYLAVYDFISGVIKYASTNRAIQLFTQAMCGNLDPATFRYVLIMNDFIAQVEWTTVKDITSFARVVYPFMGEEDLEQFTMGYTSFSENKISQQLVSEYFLYIILKYREPRFQEVEAKLLQQPGRRPGFMTDIEFAEAIDNICPLASERLRRRLFVESEEHMQNDGSVSVMRLSQITGYLILVQLGPVIKESVASKVKLMRASSDESIKSPAQDFEITTLNQSGRNFFSMSAVKAVANENARRSTARQLKRIEGYGFD